VLGRSVMRLHMLPYGTWDRPIYEKPSQLQAKLLPRDKGRGGLIPFDVPDKGLWPKLASGS